MSTHYQLDDVFQNEFVKSREGLFFLADRSVEFLKNRKLSYLKKIIEMHAKFRNKLLKYKYVSKRPFLQRFLKVKWANDNSSKTLGICFAFAFFHQDERFEYKHLVSVVRRYLPGVRIEDVYFCKFSQEKILFCYAEVEKIRGKHLTLKDTLNLKKILRSEIDNTIETIYSDLFIPSNEEEIYKHIATLSNELTLLSSLPHIMISFIKQNHDVLYFNVVLVRTFQKNNQSFEKIAKLLPFKHRIFINKTSLTSDNSIKEICVFSVEIPNSYFRRKNYSIDYLKARRYLSLILEEHIGEFRDYNGGLLIKQYEQLNDIKKKLAGKINNFDIFEELFFSFVPSNSQTLISPEVALKLHELFNKIKASENNSIYEMQYSESKDALIIFIKTNHEKVESLLYDIVLDESFLVAYTKKTIENQTYFCFLQINPSDLSFLLKLKKSLCDLEENFSKEIQDTLRIPLQESLPPTLHPHLLTDTNSLTVCKALYEGLVRVGLTGKLEFAIAKNIEISPCKMRYLITLKPTRWSNGEPLLADHFVYAWKKAILYHSRSLRHHLFFVIKNAEKISKGLLPIDNLGIKIQSNFEILVELEYPAPYFTQLLANPIYSPLYNFTDEEPEIFNGPFKLGIKEKDHEISLIKNNFYWDSKVVKLQKVSLLLIKDESKIIDMFYKKQLDWVGSPFSSFLQNNSEKSISFHKKEVTVPFWLHCNTKNSKLSSFKIRKALSLAIDRSKIGTEILLNQVPSTKIIPDDLSQINLSKKTYKEDLALAKNLFQEGLKEINQAKEGFSLTVSYSRHTAFQKVLVNFLKKIWEKVFNIKIILKELEWDVHWNNLFNGEYEIGGACQFGAYIDIYYFLEAFLSVPVNNSKWENKKFQSWMSLSKKTTSLKKQKQCLKKAEEILQEETPVIPIYNRSHLYLSSRNLKNLFPSSLAYMDFKWAHFHKK